MAKKRASPPTAGRDSGSSKLAKTDEETSAKSGDKPMKKSGKHNTISAQKFNESALPIHLSFTHTPPTIAGPDSEEAVSVAIADTGYIGNLTLVPSTFSTGSFGWKGSKRISLELQGSEANVKEKVQVQVTVNATVVGSKPTKANEQEGETDEEKLKMGKPAETESDD